MARKVFISFLGTSNYVCCNYYYKSKENSECNVRFVQEALLNLLCSDFNANDEVLIFTTEDAKKSNWFDNGQPEAVVKSDEEKIGLKTRLQILKKNGFKGNLPDDTIWIPEGFSEDQVWDTFEIIFEKLKENDEIYLDITHSFRFLPMLAIVLLNYSKFLKNIKIEIISYGDFEYLGSAYSVRNMKLEDRYAPIIEVVSFSKLQDWTTAASDFVKYGKGEAINNLLPKRIDELDDFIENFSTARGGAIYSGKNLEILTNELLNQSLDLHLIKPFKPLLEKIEIKLSRFKKVEINNLEILIDNTLQSVWWCYEHDLIQQGFTLLQEGMISISLKILDKNIKDKDLRDIASSCFIIWNKDKTEWKGKAKDYEEIAQNFIDSTNIFSLLNDKKGKTYSKITIFRNDLNHAGYTEDALNSKKFKPNLFKYLGNVKKIFEDFLKVNQE